MPEMDSLSEHAWKVKNCISRYKMNNIWLMAITLHTQHRFSPEPSTYLPDQINVMRIFSHIYISSLINKRSIYDDIQ
jgi:hypothetical protein